MKKKGKDTLREINQYAEGMLFIKDISKLEFIEPIVSEVVGNFGKLDILVNNAHASKQAPFVETTQEMFDLSLNTGFYPTFNFMKAAYSELKNSKGKVIISLQVLAYLVSRHKHLMRQRKRQFVQLHV